MIAKSPSQFDAWVAGVRSTAPTLTTAGYHQLVRPSIVHNMTFSAYPPGTFYNTVMTDGGQYMAASINMLKSMHGKTNGAAGSGGMTGMGGMAKPGGKTGASGAATKTGKSK